MMGYVHMGYVMMNHVMMGYGQEKICNVEKTFWKLMHWKVSTMDESH